MKYSDNKRKKLLSMLYWDYAVDLDTLLYAIDNDTLAHNEKERLFIKSLVKLPWHNVVGLWSFETAQQFRNESVIQKLWPKERRQHFAILNKILRNEPLSVQEWSAELRQKLKSTVLSYRWYRFK
ncbi:MAG: hypothetical protein ACUVRK_02310 [Spirochaetota bacterium]